MMRQTTNPGTLNYTESVTACPSLDHHGEHTLVAALDASIAEPRFNIMFAHLNIKASGAVGPSDNAVE